MAEKENVQLQKIRGKIAEMKVREQTLVQRDKERQRKERTRRLIQNGALAEKYLNCEGMEPLEFEEMLRKLVNLPTVQKDVN